MGVAGRHPPLRRRHQGAALAQFPLNKESRRPTPGISPLSGKVYGRGAAVAERSGLAVGAGFSLTYCAPQCAPGTVIQDLSRAPRVFGSVDQRSRELAAKFFDHVSHTILAPVRNCQTAELARLYQLCARGVNTSFASELATFGAGRDVDPQELVTNTAAQTLFPVMGPRLGHSPGEVLLALALLAREDSQAFARAALDGHTRVLARMTEQLSAALSGLEGRRILIMRTSPVADLSVADVAATLRDSGVLVTVAGVGSDDVTYDAVVCLDPIPRVAELSKLRGCRVFLDGTGRASRFQIERLGMRFLGVVPFEPPSGEAVGGQMP